MVSSSTTTKLVHGYTVNNIIFISHNIILISATRAKSQMTMDVSGFHGHGLQTTVRKEMHHSKQ